MKNALEFEQERDIFDELINHEGRETFSRKPSISTIQAPHGMTTQPDNSRKVNLS